MTSLAGLYSELHAGPNYMGSVNVLNNVMWQRDTCGHIAVDKSSRKEFVAVIVEIELRSRGKSYQSRNQPTAQGKIPVPIMPTFGSVFVEVSDKAIQNLEGLQAKFSETADWRSMIVSDKNIKLVRFTSKIFEQCKWPIPKHAVYLSDIENSEGGRKAKWSCQQFCNSPVMDEETGNWPIAMKHRDELDLVKLNYEASPLRLYRGNSLVEPADVNEALTGAVVEVFFVVRHYYLRDKKFDTF
ncbi:hypothetical protein K503DRAFT_783927 [Rhizopogon vinicolor AM-OR11-026]|uniref:Uncharacterized protein n=1 Tax=Rhizopogon vinicolor AM-OR11-026 TaxID=1314800 RepID=A0A1B7MWR0_9AGAM|nr:hypothetical protein K503DRAFT_783927 [Rhizopogon vinicolor AM-OR11-026]